MPAPKSIICIETGIIYESIHGAEKLLGKRLNIQAVLSGKRETAGGYHWRYTTEDDFKPRLLKGTTEDTPYTNPSHFVKCVETGEIFHSIREAARKMHVDEINIRSCLRGKQKTSCGFHWEYYFDKDKSQNQTNKNNKNNKNNKQ